MSLIRSITIGLAGLIAAPGVLMAVAATLYIAYSIATETFYRNWFLGYGVKMMVLHTLFVAGVVATAMLALGRWRRKRLAIAVAVVGFLAACALEFELWDDAERVLPLGLLIGPYVAWIAATFVLRKFPPPPPAASWADTRF